MTYKEAPICDICGEEKEFVEHWEHDYESGSYEPYWECINKCEEET